ncbi:dihydrofolate reductase family protein [Candidatus Nitrosocosmicus arcticus]|uniref:Bifunctional deaminase-reductase domain protein n=1 Tax=Candidatus Nitrosocosmicus arcticus TaxID=2035267 RepID=A0A557SY57_9ARCH|nr:dihydrofolate reductase family protein [Candidatus Nitrosocosmicus arcticus]TVP41538.1 Bifunctional deaminase-reductase domain protein [Candidatus Nitrosocosmicus arcticus]
MMEVLIGWIKLTSKVHEGDDFGYNIFLESVDALILGRNTYEKVLKFAVLSYKEKRVIVLTTSKIKIPFNLANTVTASKDSPQDILKHLSDDGIKHVYIVGGITIQSFLSLGLIYELAITIIPLLIGEGKQPFGSIPTDITLTHSKSTFYDFGYIQLKYIIQRE